MSFKTKLPQIPTSRLSGSGAGSQIRFYSGLSHAELVALYQEQVEAQEVDLLLHGPLFHNTPTYKQAGQRAYLDSAVAVDSLVAAAAENIGYTLDLSGGNVDLIIRMEMEETNNGSGNQNGNIEYQVNDGGYNLLTQITTDVQSTGTGHLCTTSNGTFIGNVLTTSGATFTSGEGPFQNNNGTGNMTFAGLDHVEVAHVVTFVAANLSDADTVNFRFINATTWDNVITITIDKTASIALDVDAFRFYDDGTEAGAVAAWDENSPGTWYPDDVGYDADFQLRLRIQNTTATAGAATDDYQLQYRLNGVTWLNVTAASAVVRANTGSALTDGSASTNRLTAGTGSFVAGEQEEANGAVEDFTHTASNYTNHVWALTLQTLADRDEVEYRVLLNGAVTNMTYSVTPRQLILKAFALRQVERFTISLASGAASDTATLSTTLLDISKAFVFWTTRSEDTSNTGRQFLRCEITNTTTVTVNRGITGAAVEIIGYVIEGTAGIAVERETMGESDVPFDTTDPQTKSLSLIADIGRAWVKGCWDTDSSTWDGDDQVEYWLSLVSGIPTVHGDMHVTNAFANLTLDMEVVQMSNILVQRDSFTSWSTTSTTDAIATAIDQAKAFLLFNDRHANGAGDPALTARWRLRGRITSTTQLTFDRDDATSNIESLHWEVVEFQDDTTVDEVLSSFTNGGAADGTDQTNDETIALTATAKAFALCPWVFGGKADYEATSQIEICATVDITTTTNLQFKRDMSYGNFDAVAYAIEFEPPKFDQLGFRFYEDSATDADSLTAMAAENTNADLADPVSDMYLHCRFEFENTNNYLATGELFQLYVSKNSGAYVIVDTTSSNIRGANSLAACTTADGFGGLTNLLTTSAKTFDSAQHEEDNGLAQFTITADQHAELNIAVQVRAADVTVGDTFDFRLYQGSTPVPMDAYTRTPRLTLVTAGETVVAGLASETDTAFAVTITPGGYTVVAGLASETDTAFAVTISSPLTQIVGLASETDTAFAVTITPGALTTIVGLASETDTAFAVTITPGALTTIVGLASETDTAFAVTILQGQTVVAGLASETDTAFAVTITPGALTTIVSLASETDTAFAVTVTPGAFTVVAGLASETDTAFAVTATAGVLTTVVGLASETDTAFGVTITPGAVTVVVGLASETDTAFAQQINQTYLVGLASETDTAFAVTITPGALTTIVGLASETDTAFAVTITPGALTTIVGLASETDTAFGVTVLTGQMITVGLALETDTAFGVTITAGAFTVVVGLASETDTAFAVTIGNALSALAGLASETDTAFGVTITAGALTTVVGLASETDTAFAIEQIHRGIPVGLASETDTAFDVTVDAGGPQTIVAGLASETDTAFATRINQVFRVKLAPTPIAGHAGVDAISEYTQGRRTSHTIPLPAGIVAGDLICVHYVHETLSDTIVWGGGFTVRHTYSANSPRMEFATLVASGGETSVLVNGWSGSKKGSATAWRIRGAADPDVVALDFSSVATATSTDPDSPSLSPAGGSKKYLFLSCGGSRSSLKPTAGPSGYENFMSVNTTAGLGDTTAFSASKQVEAASEDPPAFTSSSTIWYAFTVAVHPVSTDASGEIALPVKVVMTQHVGLANETDTAFAVTIGSALATIVGLASETDTAFAVTITPGGYTVVAGLASETDTAFAVTIGSALSAAAGLASETDTAFAVTITPGALTTIVGLASETDTAFATTIATSGGPQTVVVGLASEFDIAHRVTSIGGNGPPQTIVVGLASEADSTLPIAIVGGIQPAVLTNFRGTTIWQVSTLVTKARGPRVVSIWGKTPSLTIWAGGSMPTIWPSLQLAPPPPPVPPPLVHTTVVVGLASEADSAFAVTINVALQQFIAVGLASEADSAFSVIVGSTPPPPPPSSGVFSTAFSKEFS